MLLLSPARFYRHATILCFVFNKLLQLIKTINQPRENNLFELSRTMSHAQLKLNNMTVKRKHCN